ncbi:MAG: sigma-54 dependent transcriptional regulator [Acidobacteriota bacterium]
MDDEDAIRWALRQELQTDFDILEAGSVQQAIKQYEMHSPVATILDLKLPDGSGLDVLTRIRDTQSDAVVVIMTAFSDVDTAIQAMKLGAYEYLKKPFDLREIRLLLGKAIDSARLRQRATHLYEQVKQRSMTRNIVGASPAVRKVVELIRQAASAPTTTVLIHGESGTGKGLVARAIHHESLRAQEPFVELNCAAIPEPLIESELVGHERGAFTDAKWQRKGLFELANCGALFLDEVADLSLSAQAKILKIIEDKVIRRIGGSKELNVDVRIIAATNKNLPARVETGKFRQDLYYRLNVFAIPVPPLRERQQDIPVLARHFLGYFSQEMKKDIRGLATEVEACLAAYPWPGNVRELRNVMERAVLVERGAYLSFSSLPEEVTNWSSSQMSSHAISTGENAAEAMSLAENERLLIRKALEKTKGNQAGAARLLGISRFALRYRMEKHGILSPGDAPE